jgi:hypothetical protein
MKNIILEFLPAEYGIMACCAIIFNEENLGQNEIQTNKVKYF